jgi:glycosyltransferase involved in cell wall biosynthesis
MNWQQLKYRIRVGGLPWVAKTGIGVIRERLRPAKAAAPAPGRFTLGATSPDAPSILYIHSGWAIETVGRLWFTDQTIARVTFIRASDPALTAELMAKHDLVWYGYSSLFRNHPCDPSKAILAVHDPAELFPERADWKTSGSISEERAAHLRSVRAVVVISVEMQEILKASGIHTLRLPTRSAITPRPSSEIAVPLPPAMLGVGRIYRRKNFEQFQRIARAARRLGIRAYLKGDHFPLSEVGYIALLDRHPIYLCTSFQEGGPLPVMDAMLRGAVVLTTPVGQAPEIIEHGKNGFICQTDAEFLSVLQMLADDPAQLQRLRVASRDRILEARTPGIIHEAVSHALGYLFRNQEHSFVPVTPEADVFQR